MLILINFFIHFYMFPFMKESEKMNFLSLMTSRFPSRTSFALSLSFPEKQFSLDFIGSDLGGISRVKTIFYTVT